MDKGCLPGGYKDVQPGDCVVAFSRNDIYQIKATIESATGRRCVYHDSLLVAICCLIFSQAGWRWHTPLPGSLSPWHCLVSVHTQAHA